MARAGWEVALYELSAALWLRYWGAEVCRMGTESCSTAPGVEMRRSEVSGEGCEVPL